MNLTILTPAYNRAKELMDLFESLKAQSNQDFIWLIIDDGSQDNTENVINEIKNENNGFVINYFKKNNGGKHTALNYGFTKIDTKYCLIVDSDDILKPMAVDFFIRKWAEVKNDEIAAISCLCENKQGDIIGDKFFEHGMCVSHLNLVYEYGVHGDKMQCYRTDVLQEYNFPVFIGETFLTEAVVWNRIGLRYKKICFNESLLIAEYHENGLTKNVSLLHKKNLLGSALYHYEISMYDTLPSLIKFKHRAISVKYMLQLFFKQIKINMPALLIGTIIFVRNSLK